MGSRKNYKASVWSWIRSVPKDLCVCVCLCYCVDFLLSTPRGSELLCHLWSQLHLCGRRLSGVFVVPHEKNRKTVDAPRWKALTALVDRWHVFCFTANWKQNQYPLVHLGRTQPGPPIDGGWVFHAHAFSQKGRLLGKTICLKQVVFGEWTFASSRHSGAFQPFEVLFPANGELGSCTPDGT